MCQQTAAFLHIQQTQRNIAFILSRASGHLATLPTSLFNTATVSDHETFRIGGSHDHLVRDNLLEQIKSFQIRLVPMVQMNHQGSKCASISYSVRMSREEQQLVCMLTVHPNKGGLRGLIVLLMALLKKTQQCSLNWQRCTRDQN